MYVFQLEELFQIDLERNMFECFAACVQYMFEMDTGVYGFQLEWPPHIDPERNKFECFAALYVCLRWIQGCMDFNWHGHSILTWRGTSLNVLQLCMCV